MLEGERLERERSEKDGQEKKQLETKRSKKERVEKEKEKLQFPLDGWEKKSLDVLTIQITLTSLELKTKSPLPGSSLCPSLLSSSRGSSHLHQSVPRCAPVCPARLEVPHTFTNWFLAVPQFAQLVRGSSHLPSNTFTNRFLAVPQFAQLE